MRRKFVLGAVAACAVVMMIVVSLPAQQVLTPREELGKAIFFDEALSLNGNQSCASCHGPAAGWTGPLSSFNAHGAVYEGSIPGAFGDRKPPSAAYATQSPIFHRDRTGLFVGGNFWDGRATGEKLGNPAADQAQGPFLNPKEQALSTPGDVVGKICGGAYRVDFISVCGAAACSASNVQAAYDCVGLSVAAYEASAEVNAFSSKFDYGGSGGSKPSKDEQRGHALFMGKAKCAKCHIASGRQPLFTDYTFDNLGLPKNPENPVYDYNPAFVDPGLGGFLEQAGYPEEVYESEWGKHKVPTVRNVGKGLEAEPPLVKAFGHNGYFKTLEGIVHFYNTRDIKAVCPGPYTEAQALAANCWPAPEVPENVNEAELGNLGLSADEEAAIVAFLKTLSDGYLTKK
jgi:cytochrome c peroxidase